MTTHEVARHRAEMPEGTHAILDTRSLANDHRRLAELLAPGLAVLDVGCGTGAITRGIADAVGPSGRVVGVDVTPGFIEEARRRHAGVAHLTFALADIHTFRTDARFDVVTTARVLQWLSRPGKAVRAMAALARPGGRVVALDYSHEKIAWDPAPPDSMRRFYAAFLAWRAEAGMDNLIADHLVSLFEQAALAAIRSDAQHETTKRGDPDFVVRAGIWADVAATRGHQMVADGAVDEATRVAAEREYREWVTTKAERQTMYLLAVDGVRRV
jgi:ubiquinone/menaquinone biosynthesis C-methylase UbiE